MLFPKKIVPRMCFVLDKKMSCVKMERVKIMNLNVNRLICVKIHCNLSDAMTTHVLHQLHNVEDKRFVDIHSPYAVMVSADKAVAK